MQLFPSKDDPKMYYLSFGRGCYVSDTSWAPNLDTQTEAEAREWFLGFVDVFRMWLMTPDQYRRFDENIAGSTKANPYHHAYEAFDPYWWGILEENKVDGEFFDVFHEDRAVSRQRS